jgi:hypothetical protein
VDELYEDCELLDVNSDEPNGINSETVFLFDFLQPEFLYLFSNQKIYLGLTEE